MSATEYPVVWQHSAGYARDFPAKGDVLLAINGAELVSKTDKMVEAADVIKSSPERPIRLLFQPHVDDSHKVAVFRGERLGINLATGASTGHLPVLCSDVRSTSQTCCSSISQSWPYLQYCPTDCFADFFSDSAIDDVHRLPSLSWQPTYVTTTPLN